MIAGIAERLALQIREATHAKNEEEFKFKVQPLLNSALEEMGITPDPQYERVVYKQKRADVIYPAVVIEYKKPFAFEKKRKQQEAVKELSYYLKGLFKKPSDKYIGIALDGNKIIFVKAKASEEKSGEARSTLGQLTLDGKIVTEVSEIRGVEINGPHRVDATSIEQMLLYLRQLNRKILAPEKLAEDFGSNSNIGRRSVQTLYEIFTSSNHSKVNTLYAEWERVFGIVYGDSSVYFPLLCSYVLSVCRPRRSKEIYARKDRWVKELKDSYFKNNRL